MTSASAGVSFCVDSKYWLVRISSKISGVEVKNGDYSNSRLILAKVIIVSIAELFWMSVGACSSNGHVIC
jgi:hypothetical protein